MGYFIDAKATRLEDLKQRLQETDLIPSQEPLLGGITNAISALEKTGIHNLADLRANLKTKKSLAVLAEKSGVSKDYLVLLRRTINGFFPKPRPFKDMVWLHKPAVLALQDAGLKNTRQLFEAKARQLPDMPNVDQETLAELVAISDLCRVQWVSPNFARGLVAAGFDTALDVANADPEVLATALEAANRDGKFYKGKVGLRDIRRLVFAARYVP